MILFVKYIAAIISSLTLLFSTTGVSLLHHLCLHSGNHEVTVLYESPNEDECGHGNSCCPGINEGNENTQPSFTMLDCCKDFTNYAVISVSFISQQIEKLSNNKYLNETVYLNNNHNLIADSFNKILLKPPGILKLPVSNIISFILHSTDISSELPA